MSDSKQFLTRKEAAAIAKTTPVGLYMRERRGNGPPVHKIGPRTTRYRLDELLAWLEGGRVVSWTDEEGNTKKGPFSKLAAAARARGVIVRGNSFAQLAAAGNPDETLPVPTGDFLPCGPGNADLPDINYLNAEPDQLTGDVLRQPVRRFDEYGTDRGVRPLINHMQASQAEFGVKPNRNVLDPSEPAEGK